MRKPRKQQADAMPAIGDSGGPCAACRGPHELRGCNTEAAAAMLRADDRIMSAVEVERRIGGGR